MHANIKLVSADINDRPVHAASALNHDDWPWQRPPKVNKSIFIAPGNPEYILHVHRASSLDSEAENRTNFGDN